MQGPEADTLSQYDQALAVCRTIFIDKTRDYGTAWRVLRPVSITDQIFIKAQRIRNIQELGRQRIGEGTDEEFRGIVNYALIGLIQEELDDRTPLELTTEQAVELYDEKAAAVRDLMQAKNHDYGEAWRQMSQEAFADLILMKLMRIRQILQNHGRTTVSEGTGANFSDIVNYGLFALIRLSEFNPSISR